MTRKARSPDLLRRRRPGIEPKQIVLIVCEGQTEERYFGSLWQELRVPTVQVEIVHKDPAPISVVREAVRRKKERMKEARAGRAIAYDQVWCVFDVEQVGQSPSLPQALDMAKANKLSLAISNPCFEYWVLLHFVRTGSAFSGCKAVVHLLHKHLPRYQKGDDVFAVVYPRTEKAVARAEAVRKQHGQHESDPVKCNPCTQVHLLVQELHRIAAPPYAPRQQT